MGAHGAAVRQAEQASSPQLSDFRATFALEADLLRAAEDYLKRRGGDVWFTRINSGRIGKVRGAKRGTADILACVRGGRFLGLELKAARGKSNADQLEFREFINKLGGSAVEVRTVADVHAAVEGAMR